MSFIIGAIGLGKFASSIFTRVDPANLPKHFIGAQIIKADPASLIVDDSGYQTASEYFTRHGERYEEAIKAYVSILNEICSEGIISGDTADAMRAFAEYAGELQGTIGDVMKQAAEQCTQFVSNVDSADQFLY